MAQPQVPGDGHPQARRCHRRLLPSRPAALDRQLRPPVRLHLRVPHQLRHSALCHVRAVRAAAEDCAALGLRHLCPIRLHRAHPALLHEPYPRL